MPHNGDNEIRIIYLFASQLAANSSKTLIELSRDNMKLANAGNSGSHIVEWNFP